MAIHSGNWNYVCPNCNNKNKLILMGDRNGTFERICKVCDSKLEIILKDDEINVLVETKKEKTIKPIKLPNDYAKYKGGKDVFKNKPTINNTKNIITILIIMSSLSGFATGSLLMDFFSDDYNEYKEIKKFVRSYLPRYGSVVEHYSRRDPIFDHYNIEMEIDIGGFSFEAPDWVPGIGGEGWGWAGYNEKITLGSWPTFDIAAVAAAADTTTGTDPLVNRAGRQYGGYVTAMANGGYGSMGGSYLVGEQGPELFTPNQSGQIINNSRTNNILRNQLDAGVHANQANAGASLNVQNLHVGKFTAGRSKFKVDTFAGVA